MRLAGLAGISMLVACSPLQIRSDGTPLSVTAAPAATNANSPTLSQEATAEATAVTTAETTAATTAANTTAPGKSPDDLPLLRLTPEILYQLTLSEIAAQRGMSGSAFATLYSLAGRTRDPRIARRAAEMALISRQPANALLAARLWSSLAPNSAEASDTVLNMLIVSGQFDEAGTTLSRDLLDPVARPKLFLQLNSVLARGARPAEAFDLMERLAAPYPRLPEARLALAQAAHGAGNKERAEAEIRAALALRPNWELAALLGAQYLQAETPRAASELLSDFLTRNLDASAVRMALGRSLATEERYADAAAQFQIVLRAEPNNMDAIYALGLLAYQAQRLNEAEEFFNRYLSIAASAKGEYNTNQVYLQLAQIADDRKTPDAALSLLQKIEEGPEFIPAMARQANILARMSQLDRARQVLRDARATSTRERVQLIQIEAQLLREANQHQTAFEVLDTALAEQPENPELLYEHGMVAERLDRIDVMEKSLRTLMRIRPEAAHAYNALGYSLADRNIRLPEALVLIERAHTLAPNDGAIMDSMGWIHYRLGNLEKALDYLQRAYKLQPDAEVATHLGEVLWVMGRHEEAQRLWREASQKEPQNAVLRETLVRFNADIVVR